MALDRRGEPLRSNQVTQEPIHRAPAAVRAEDAKVCAMDRKMVGVVAVTSGARRAFANQAGLLPEVLSVLDTLAAKTPLPVHKFH
jgi:hypothetical protein